MQYIMTFDMLDDSVLQAVGQIKWLIKKLSQLCVPDRVIVTPNSDIMKELPLLMLEHIESNSGNIHLDYKTTIELQSTGFLFDERHILYAKLRPYLNKVALPNFRGICTTELVPILPYPNVSRRYLAWLLRKPETVAFAMQGTTGGRMPRANIDELLSFEVSIPESIDEQERLSDIIEYRIKLIEQAKSSCLRQLELLEILRKRLLTDFSCI